MQRFAAYVSWYYFRFSWKKSYENKKNINQLLKNITALGVGIATRTKRTTKPQSRCKKTSETQVNDVRNIQGAYVSEMKYSFFIKQF